MMQTPIDHGVDLSYNGPGIARLALRILSGRSSCRSSASVRGNFVLNSLLTSPNEKT